MVAVMVENTILPSAVGTVEIVEEEITKLNHTHMHVMHAKEVYFIERIGSQRRIS